MTPANLLRWVKIRAGLYRAVHGGHVYEVERFGSEDTGRCVVWHSRIDGEPFDAGDTMAEAKQWCEKSAAPAVADSAPDYVSPGWIARARARD